MSEKIKLAQLTGEEKKALKAFAHDRIEDYLDSDDEEGANRWRRIAEHIHSGYLTREEIDEIIDDIYMVIEDVWCDMDHLDEVYTHYSIIKKLSRKHK